MLMITFGPQGRGVVLFAVLAITHAVMVAVAHAQITPDGRTATTVTQAPNGKSTIIIAAPVSNTGTSLNAYSQFNVSTAGADLDNRTAQARLIVNEVTGGQRSTLEGDITILGPRANMIIANPAGLWVNGAQFLNVGSLALSTGATSTIDFVPSAGLTQRDVLLTVKGGEIEIGPKGLSGAFNSLDLLSRSLRIGGPVMNTTTQPNSGTRVIAGATRTQFDTTVSPVDDVTPWAYTGKLKDAAPSTKPIAVDITALGSLTAGKVVILVTDAGAGVRQSGALATTVGDLQISSTGALSYAGGMITSSGSIVLASDAGITTQLGDSGQPTHLVANKAVQVLAPTLSLQGIAITAGSATQEADVVIGQPADRGGMTGPLTIGAATTASGVLVPSRVQASGGLALVAEGQSVSLHGIHIDAQGSVSARAHTLNISGAGSTQTAYVASELISARGLVDVQTTGNVSVQGTQLQGGAGLQIGAEAVSITGYTDNSGLVKSALKSNGGSVEINTRSAMAVNGADLIARNAVVLDVAGDLTLRSDAKDHSDAAQSVISAVEGGTLIRATGNVLNEGTLIQGHAGFQSTSYLRPFDANQKPQRIESIDAVQIATQGTFINRSTHAEQLAIVFGAAGKVSINAQGDIQNAAGRIISNSTLDLRSASGDVRNETTIAPSATGGSLVYVGQNDRWGGIIPRSNKTWSRDFGALSVPGTLPFLVSESGTSIEGRNVINLGGTINVNNGDLRITAADRIAIAPLLSGSISTTQRCLILCRRSAVSTIAVNGGSVNASGHVNLKAKTVENLGGRVQGLSGIAIDAALTRAEAIESYMAVGLYRGLARAFGNNWAQIVSGDVGGEFISKDGEITLSGNLVIDGGALKSPSAALVKGTTTVLREPRPFKVDAPELGWFWGW
jgi:filamentous hemagglutinin family protein